MLLSSHLLDQVQAVCDRVALFNHGKIAIEGTVEALSGQVLGGGYRRRDRSRRHQPPKVFGSIDGVLRVTEAGNGKYHLVASRDIRAELGAAIVASGGALMRLDHIEPSLDTVYRHYFEGQRSDSMARRSGSVWTGCGTVFMKEFADHLGSGRMRVLEWLVLLTGIGAVYTAIQDLKTTTSQDPFLFLRLFTDAHDPLPSFMAVLGFLIPLVAIGLGFDAVNGEFNRRTMSRILAQPVYRDALLLGKFFAGIATLGVALVTLWLLIIGLGLLTLGVPPTGEEVARGVGFLSSRSPMAASGSRSRCCAR